MRLYIFCFFLLITACVPLPRHSQLSRPRRHSSQDKIIYHLKEGDTLWKISKRFGVSVKSLMKINKLYSPSTLKVGQPIIIPVVQRKNTHKVFKFQWPIKGEIVSYFGQNTNNLANKGLDIKTKDGQFVRASSGGQIIFIGYLNGWGETLILKHRNSMYTVYCPLKELTVQEGASVKGGEVIGKTTSSANQHSILHFEVRKQHLPQNPLLFLNK